MRWFVLLAIAVVGAGIGLACSIPVQAVEESDPYAGWTQVLINGKPELIDPAAFNDCEMFRVIIQAWHGDELLREFEPQGIRHWQLTAWDVRFRWQTVAFDSLIIIDPADGRYDMPPDPYLELIPQQFYEAMQHFTLGGLRLSVYLPGADRIELQVFSSYRPAPKLLCYPGSSLPEYQGAEPGPFVPVAALSAPLDTPDQGFVQALELLAYEESIRQQVVQLGVSGPGTAMQDVQLAVPPDANN
jgi:hypothetical protein